MSVKRQEINAVLSRSKFVTFEKRRRLLLGTLFNQALMVLPKRIEKSVFSDENDHFLYELTVTGEASFIVTGDKGMLKIKKISGVEVVTPGQFCKKLRIK